MDFFKRVMRILKGIKCVAITCLQWGDTGKGKIVDALASWAHVIARGTGGANAGHTICLGGAEHIFHLVPSGILHDREGKVNIIGSGVALDPGIIGEELALLDSAGLPYNNLAISHRAHLVLPQHLLLDRLKERRIGRLGTTGRGIGPLYTDQVARVGLRVNDILDEVTFAKKLIENLVDKRRLLTLEDPDVIKEILHHPHLGSGRFWSAGSFLNVDEIVAAYMEHAERLRDMIRDTDAMMRQAMSQGKNVLLEGAQGNWLSVRDGSYPFVTSSDCSVHGLADGVGLDMRDIGLSLGIAKFPYMTRVGEGPFPTELGGEESAKWCGMKGVNREKEREDYGTLSVNDTDQFLQGIGIRQAGGEYGATTKRPRRTGWLDLPMLRTSMRRSGNNVIFTKPDVLDDCGVIRICDHYIFTGGSYRVGEKTWHDGDVIEFAPREIEVMERCEPHYVEFAGWKTPISGITEARDLPANFRAILDFVVEQTGANPRMISVGADREQTIVMD